MAAWPSTFLHQHLQTNPSLMHTAKQLTAARSRCRVRTKRQHSLSFSLPTMILMASLHKHFCHLPPPTLVHTASLHKQEHISLISRTQQASQLQRSISLQAAMLALLILGDLQASIKAFNTKPQVQLAFVMLSQGYFSCTLNNLAFW